MLLEGARAVGPVVVVLKGDAAVEVDSVVAMRIGRGHVAGDDIVRGANGIGLVAESRVSDAAEVGGGRHCKS